MVIITYAGCFVTKISVYVYEYHLQHVKTIRFFFKICPIYQDLGVLLKKTPQYFVKVKLANLDKKIVF